ncbi:uncharacterized protein H6S33_012865 [Morchella sextelata]|uniref:uncharacterized protein n=1 Tax=Morchella sextelata TaxID=1174677 RepID=UPI001D03B485|nr:uncharacterized protein H6S33_012865 [Morchella sextelata]KAH0609379.1 hypothetical protein H6S33_012865 [Morchella sextelata]
MDSLSQQRLSSVLSASYSDSEIRNALQVLDARFTDNSPDSRRQLRVDIQAEVIRSNAHIIEEFAKIAEQLKHIGTTLSTMNAVVSSLRTNVAAASSETAPILDEASELLSQKKDVETKEALLSAFTAHFVVSEEDVLVLTSSAETLDDRFFRILSRVKRIHSDCEVLLASENQRAGMEIMDLMTKHLHDAFQKLYRWIQRELKHLSLESPQINSGIRRALRVLAERPTLFQDCLDFFAEARQKILLDSFYTALTGAPQGTPGIDSSTKPIELYAHDPLRYIGDMLAWLHSSAVGEQEALEVLFISQEGEGQNSILGGIEEGLKSEPWVGDYRDDALEALGGWDARKGLMMLVDKGLETVCKPLKSRIEQVVASHEDSTLAYRISNLINYYRLTFEKLLGEDSSLLETIKSVEQSALRQFHSTLQAHVRAVQSDLPQAPPDLSPPDFLLEGLKELKDLMVSYEASLAPTQEREEEFSKILEEAFDPYIEGCRSLRKDLDELQSNIFGLNCMLAAKSTLDQFLFTAKRVSMLDDEIKTYIKALVEYEHNFFVHTSGLNPLLVALDDWNPTKTPLTQLPPFSLLSLAQVSQTLDKFLQSALMDVQAELRRLNSPKVVGEISHEAAERFVEDFRRVEEAVVNALANEMEEGMDGARNVWPRTVDEVRVLLT